MTGTDADDDNTDVCGESFDHDLALIDERDGYTTYECRTCGTEVFTEPEDEEDQ